MEANTVLIKESRSVGDTKPLPSKYSDYQEGHAVKILQIRGLCARVMRASPKFHYGKPGIIPQQFQLI